MSPNSHKAPPRMGRGAAAAALEVPQPRKDALQSALENAELSCAKAAADANIIQATVATNIPQRGVNIGLLPSVCSRRNQIESANSRFEKWDHRCGITPAYFAEQQEPCQRCCEVGCSSVLIGARTPTLEGVESSLGQKRDLSPVRRQTPERATA